MTYGSVFVENFYIANLLLACGLSSTLLVYLGRFDPENPKTGAFQRMLFGVMAWAFFDLAVHHIGRNYSAEIGFAVYRVLSFLFLFYVPLAGELILSLIKGRVNIKTRIALYAPFLGMYLIAIAAPSLVSAQMFGIDVGAREGTALFNVVFKGYTLILVFGLLFRLMLNARSEKDLIAQKEKTLLFFGGMATLGGISLSQVVVSLFGPGMPWMANLATSTTSLAAFWGLKRYGRVLSSRTLYEATVRLIPNGIMHLKGGRIIWANKSMVKMSGHEDPEHLVGCSLENFLVSTPLDNQSGDLSPASCLSDSRCIDREILLKVREGSSIACLVSKIPFDESDPGQGSLAVFTDISDRKVMEETLRESEDKYRSLVERSNDGIAMIQEERLKFVNSRLAKMLGYTVDEMLEEPFERYFCSEEVSKVVGIYKSRMAGEAPPAHYETILRHRDGSELHIEINAGIIHYQGRTADLVFVRDVSERKKAEKLRKKMETRLQHAQKMEAIGTLAGGVAHDLNNILSGLISYPELLLLDIPEASPLRGPLLTVKKSGEKAATIVQDLLTLGRRGVAVEEVMNLNTIIADYLKSPEHEKILRFHPDVEVAIRFQEPLPNMQGSPFHLSKTLMNLVANAAEAMPRGGRVRIETENIEVEPTAADYEEIKTGQYVVLRITDDGVGLSDEEKEQIFEPFYTKKVMGRSGTGLGMAVVWGTVKDHNGHIAIDSSKGNGTSFTLYFPTTGKSIKKDEADFSIEHYQGRGETVLVVDDVPEQRDVARSLLTRLGYRIETAPSGEKAVEYLKDHRVELILLDMIMDPGMDGLETLREIIKLHPRQKTILVSGFSKSERVKGALSLGASRYIKKPYTLLGIATAVRELLGEPPEIAVT